MTVDQPTIFVVDEIGLLEPHAEMFRVRRGVTPHQIGSLRSARLLPQGSNWDRHTFASEISRSATSSSRGLSASSNRPEVRLTDRCEVARRARRTSDYCAHY